MANIEVFTQSFCPFCARAVNLLTGKDVQFTEIDAPNGSEARKTATARSGGKTSVPQIFINGDSVGGFDDLVALDRAGRLDPLLAG